MADNKRETLDRVNKDDNFRIQDGMDSNFLVAFMAKVKLNDFFE